MSIVAKRAQTITLAKFYHKAAIDFFIQRNSIPTLLEKAKKRKFFVAEINKKVVGYLSIKRNELRSFYVDPNYQGKGIGRKLFERYKKEAIKRGYKTLSVQSSYYAVPIYKSLGFKVIRKVHKNANGIKYYDTLMKQRV